MTDPAPPSRGPHDVRSISGAFRLLASTSVLTLIFGIVTNKLVAVYAGPDGIASLTIYRNLTNFLIAAVSLGMTNVVIQRISTSRDDQEKRTVLVGLLRLVLAQVVVIVLVGLLLGPLVTSWMFESTADRVVGIRVAILFAIGVFTMQMALEVLNGLTAVKQVSRVTLLTSFLTMATTYPLICLGRVGIAMMLGLTCFAGTALALRYITRAMPFSLRGAMRKEPFRWSGLPLSAPVAIRGIVTTGVLLLVQSIISHGFGTNTLGVYTSASTLESNAVMLLVGFMRPYYLPSLGSFATEREKNAFANRVLEFLLVLAIPGIVALVLLSPFVLELLFSHAFAAGSDYLSILGISMLAQTMLYTYGFYFVHRAAYRTILWIDCTWAVLLALGVGACAWLHAPVTTLAWTYATSYVVYAVIYVSVGRRLFGADLLSRRNLLLATLGFGWLLLCYVVAHRSIGERLAFAGVTVVAFGSVALRARPLSAR